jgi:hypothetical protein
LHFVEVPRPFSHTCARNAPLVVTREHFNYKGECPFMNICSVFPEGLDVVILRGSSNKTDSVHITERWGAFA